MSDEPDFPALLASIDRCIAAYETNHDAAFAAFEALGSQVLGRYCDDKHQAVAHIAADGVKTLTLSGSRVSSFEADLLATLGDLFEDVDFAPLEIVPGVAVATGAHDGLAGVFSWALGLFGDDGDIRVEGHSLGGQRTHLAPLWVAPERLHSMLSWEPPKAANDGFYAAHPEHFAKCITVINGRDPWAAWPWTTSTLEHPDQLLWFDAGGWSVVKRADWPGCDPLTVKQHFSDHVPENVRSVVGKLVAA